MTIEDVAAILRTGPRHAHLDGRSVITISETLALQMADALTTEPSLAVAIQSYRAAVERARTCARDLAACEQEVNRLRRVADDAQAEVAVALHALKMTLIGPANGSAPAADPA